MSSKYSYVNEGGFLTLPAATALTKGTVQTVQDVIGIVGDTVASGELYTLWLAGQHELAKNTGVNLTAGEDVYWDATPGELTTNQSNGTRIGVAAKAATTTATRGRILLNQINHQLVAQT